MAIEAANITLEVSWARRIDVVSRQSWDRSSTFASSELDCWSWLPCRSSHRSSVPSPSCFCLWAWLTEPVVLDWSLGALRPSGPVSGPPESRPSDIRVGACVSANRRRTLLHPSDRGAVRVVLGSNQNVAIYCLYVLTSYSCGVVS